MGKCGAFSCLLAALTKGAPDDKLERQIVKHAARKDEEEGSGNEEGIVAFWGHFERPVGGATSAKKLTTIRNLINYFIPDPGSLPAIRSL